MLIRVVDFETTGLAPPDAAVCEVGWSDISDKPGSREAPFSFVCDPGRPIPAEARAVHHIRDDELSVAMPRETLFRALMEGPPDAFVAHNCAFERQFFGGGDRPWICTLKVARRPDCPSHSNQCLRYWLGLELDVEHAMPPHRAGPDAFVTRAILQEALKLTSITNMIAWTEQPSLLPRITFGKHRGSKWADVPRDYLEWIAKQRDMDPDAVFTARHWLKRAA